MILLLIAGLLGFAASARDHYERGSRLFVEQRFAEAADELRASLRLEPGQPRPVRLLGLCYQLLQRPEDAEKSFLEATRLSPRDAESWFFLGRVYYNGNYFDKALRALETSVRLNPRDPRSRECLALTWEASGEIARAIEHYQEAVRLNESSPGRSAAPELNYGILLSKLERLEEAERRLEKAKQLAPADWRARFELGKLYFRTGRPDASIAELESALAAAKDQDKAQVFRVLGQVYYRAGRDAEAATAFRMAESAEKRVP